MKCAVVGHVEWVDFARVERLPRPGEIIAALESWAEPAGGGGVSVVQLARMCGHAVFFTALGDDDVGRRTGRELEALGVSMRVAWKTAATRRAFTFVDAQGERTITTMGERLEPRAEDDLPWGELDDVDAVYFTAGDEGALREARRAKAVVATARILPLLRRARVRLDAVVHSASDPSEHYAPGDLDPPPCLVVSTAGRDGGRWEAADGFSGVWTPAPLERPIVDAYGAGDSFAAGLAFALGNGFSPQEAVEEAARWSAAALTRRGAHGNAPR
ncbi:MAG TPA: PfkB family carbohydrate kinase [Gaiellaceae bacterium]|nr:PfkB family carbohydrate kinase [Gaiellaceae bacterium]